MRGSTELVVLIVILLAGGGALSLPSFFNRDKSRAETSEKATAELLEAQKAQSASAAASVVEIGRANTLAPESPSKQFIEREVPLTLSKLPAPDVKELLAAEQRRLAVMEGRLEESNRLYGQAFIRAEKLSMELDRAIEARKQADKALLLAAEARSAANRQKLLFGLLAGAFAALWVFSKIYGIGPQTAGRIVADIRQGINPVQAFDSHIPDYLKPSVRKAAKLEMEPND